MLSVIEVKCPHCGAQGKIVLPPLGAIIIGPCPECQGMVAIFCGNVLPLDKDIMLRGKVDEKREHLLEVLGLFLHERVEQMFEEKVEDPDLVFPDPPIGDSEPAPLLDSPPRAPISQTELDSFLNTDLRMIDNKEYFKAVFG